MTAILCGFRRGSQRQRKLAAGRGVVRSLSRDGERQILGASQCEDSSAPHASHLVPGHAVERTRIRLSRALVRGRYHHRVGKAVAAEVIRHIKNQGSLMVNAGVSERSAQRRWLQCGFWRRLQCGRGCGFQRRCRCGFQRGCGCRFQRGRRLRGGTNQLQVEVEGFHVACVITVGGEDIQRDSLIVRSGAG